METRLRLSEAKRSTIRRIHLSEKSKALLKARIERFDGDFLFPQNETNGVKPVKGVDTGRQSRNLNFKFRLYD